MTNDKYEITDIAHPEYPWLHRIRALQDVGKDVKKGDLGGYVESESNLSFEPKDNAWLFDDSIACNTAYVCQDSCLYKKSMAKDKAYISKGSSMSGSSIVEDDAMIQGASLYGNARISGTALSSRSGYRPTISGDESVYGLICGNFHLDGQTVILEGEKLYNQRDDRIILSNGIRYVLSDEAKQSPEVHPKAGQRHGTSCTAESRKCFARKRILLHRQGQGSSRSHSCSTDGLAF